MAPWLSILIPVYNVEPFLQECLESVFSQVDDRVEIIALDDQSNDDSYALLLALQRNTRLNFQVVQNPVNKGISGVRNSLLQMASGRYIWFLDSDDLLAPGAVAQLTEIVNAHSPDMVLCDYHIWFGDSAGETNSGRPARYTRGFAGVERTLSSQPVALFSGLYQCGKLHCWSKIFRRELCDEGIEFPEGRYFEDMVVTPRLALRAATFYYAPDAWVWYRKRAGSILAVPSKKKIDDMVAGLDDIFALWLAKCPDMPFSTRMVFIRYAVKVYFFTLKELKKIGLVDRATKRHYRDLLLKSIHCSKSALIVYYLRNGDFFRLPKLLRHL